jgi:hypothetical protein
MLPEERAGRTAIDGLFAGADPIGSSANYLESLSEKLRQQMPKKP